jgi:hypothetical protein
MPRFKTVGFTRCENGHVSLFDIRAEADSADGAGAYALAEASLAKCKYCKTHTLPALVRILRTEQILLPMRSTIWGYTCRCGERVEVARVEPRVTVIPPTTQTVTCSKGHSRTIQHREFPFLEHWESETN